MARETALQFLMAGLTDASGQPLAGGKVYCYAAGTTTPKAVYSAPNTYPIADNPIILDAQGRALVFGEGAYKFVVKTAADATLYTWDNVWINPIVNLGTATEILQVQNSTLRTTNSSTPATYGGCSGTLTKTGGNDRVVLVAELTMSGSAADKLVDISIKRDDDVLITKRSRVLSLNTAGYGTHAVALYIDAPQVGQHSYLLQWASVDGSTTIYSLNGSLTAFVLKAA